MKFEFTVNGVIDFLEHMTVLGCKLRKEDAEAFRRMCRERGTSPNAVFKEAIERFMNDEM